VELAGRGIDGEVIDLRCLRPLDTDTIVASAKRTGRVLIVHEACRFGGFGGEIAATITESEAFYHLDAPVCRVAGRDVPIPYNKHLESEVVPTQDRIVRAARDLLE
jgi:acetoin:2,6-dichlorophenolindophenol oxidoreductase subunit beta